MSLENCPGCLISPAEKKSYSYRTLLEAVSRNACQEEASPENSEISAAHRKLGSLKNLLGPNERVTHWSASSIEHSQTYLRGNHKLKISHKIVLGGWNVCWNCKKLIGHQNDQGGVWKTAPDQSDLSAMCLAYRMPHLVMLCSLSRTSSSWDQWLVWKEGAGLNLYRCA